MSWVAPARLLEAVHDSDAFADVVGQLARQLGARSYFGGFGLEDGAPELSVDSNWWTPDQIALYGSQYLAYDPCVSVMLANWQPQQVLDLERLMAPSRFEHSRLYQDFIRPMGDDTFRALGVPIELAGGKGAVTFQRGRGQQRFSSEEQARLAVAAPALAHLFAARSRILALQSANQASSEIVDALDRPMLILRADGRLVRANTAADAMLRRGELLACCEGLVHAVDHRAQTRFATMLSGYASGAVGVGTVRLRSGDGPADDALAMPLQDGTILVTVTCAEPPGRADLVREIYGLSVSEADIALRLHAGETLADIAAARGTSVHTVRQQIRAISVKMDCPRQIDIVRRIGGLPSFGAARV